MVSRAGFASLLGASFLLLLLRGAEPLGFSHRPMTAGDELSAAPSRYLTREERWLSQRLDHFSPTDHRQFNQRYFEFLDYHDDPTGPVFLRICGESSCDGLPNDYLAVIAKKFGAAVVTPEHRYYGKSSPFDSLTTDNLRFLSSKQALFDLAVFRQYYQVGQEKLNSQYNRSAGFDNPWFVFGVSYSGALSAWFRLKFPHLTCGSLASSGVVLAVYNFTDFDKQVGESAGPQCKAALQEITRLVDEQLRLDSHSVKALFGADSLTANFMWPNQLVFSNFTIFTSLPICFLYMQLKNDGDFLFLLADAAATTFQYGNPDALCSPLSNAKKKGESLVETYAHFVKDYFIKKLGTTVSSYDQEYLKETTPDDSSSRLWWFQVCSEVAYFQVAPKNDSVRSAQLNTRYNLDLCKNVYGEGVYPDVFMTNLYYGGTSIAASKIVFTNGSQDPWRHASKQNSSEDRKVLIYCTLSSLGDSSNCTSPEAVNTVRKQIVKHIDLWLSQCHEPTRSGSGTPSHSMAKLCSDHELPFTPLWLREVARLPSGSSHR
ncbi:putative serine protease EDA2 [Triticum urartu]|uniref:Putative serine protease EDA2 n=1 Tax=Triticum urartu TaxID=4572 RepID=M7Z6H6_TRIUA|nr:putative serine protease EDA2 [Triticum urartu]